ncbi:MAG TPA: hypothetical protein PL117_03355, partial [Accumulibacter sp.]|nr:hypothetical protein [Accumulibacter sp.]
MRTLFDRLASPLRWFDAGADNPGAFDAGVEAPAATGGGSGFSFTLLDAFNRASLGSTWSPSADPGDSAAQITSDQYAGAGAGSYHSAWYNVATQADAVGVASTIGTLASAVWIYTRLVTPGTAGVDGYLLVVEADGSCRIERINDAAYSVLASVGAGTFAAGDGFGIIADGTGATVTVTAYRYSGGSWSSIATYADSSASRITSAGYGGQGVFGSVSRLDDFGTLEASAAGITIVLAGAPDGGAIGSAGISLTVSVLGAPGSGAIGSIALSVPVQLQGAPGGEGAGAIVLGTQLQLEGAPSAEVAGAPAVSVQAVL